MPSSASVGTSGASGSRRGAVTPRMRTRPPARASRISPDSGGEQRSLSREQGGARLAAGVVRHVAQLARIGAGRFERERRHQVVHAAQHRSAGDRYRGGIARVARGDVGKARELRVGARGEGDVVADHRGDRNQVAPRVPQPAAQRRDHDRRRRDEQRVALALGGGDEVGERAAAASSRQVLVRRAAREPGARQRLADAARGAVPAAAGGAGDEEVRRDARRARSACCAALAGVATARRQQHRREQEEGRGIVALIALRAQIG